MRTLKEILDEIDENVPLGNLGKVMDLVDEHGNTIDRIYYAIQDGDIERMEQLEPLGIDLSDPSFLLCAVRNDQLLVVSYLMRRGFADVESLILLAEQHDRQTIWNWAKSWKTTKIKPNK